MVSSAYLRLLIFLPAILISACVSSSPAFLMMYSTQRDGTGKEEEGGDFRMGNTCIPVADSC